MTVTLTDEEAIDRAAQYVCEIFDVPGGYMEIVLPPFRVVAEEEWSTPQATALGTVIVAYAYCHKNLDAEQAVKWVNGYNDPPPDGESIKFMQPLMDYIEENDPELKAWMLGETDET